MKWPLYEFVVAYLDLEIFLKWKIVLLTEAIQIQYCTSKYFQDLIHSPRSNIGNAWDRNPGEKNLLLDADMRSQVSTDRVFHVKFSRHSQTTRQMDLFRGNIEFQQTKRWAAAWNEK